MPPLFRWEADSNPACQNEAKSTIGSCPDSEAQPDDNDQ
jgi:hypothetical protein